MPFYCASADVQTECLAVLSFEWRKFQEIFYWTESNRIESNAKWNNENLLNIEFNLHVRLKIDIFSILKRDWRLNLQPKHEPKCRECAHAMLIIKENLWEINERANAECLKCVYFVKRATILLMAVMKAKRALNQMVLLESRKHFGTNCATLTIKIDWHFIWTELFSFLWCFQNVMRKLPASFLLTAIRMKASEGAKIQHSHGKVIKKKKWKYSS